MVSRCNYNSLLYIVFVLYLLGDNFSVFNIGGGAVLRKINVSIKGSQKHYTYYTTDENIKVGDKIKVVTVRNGMGVEAVVTDVDVKNNKKHIARYYGNVQKNTIRRKSEKVSKRKQHIKK